MAGISIDITDTGNSTEDNPSDSTSTLTYKHNNSHPLIETLVAGGIAGFLSNLLLYPMDSLTFTKQMGRPTTRSTLMKGVVPSTLAAGAGAAAFLVTYNIVKTFCDPLVADENTHKVSLLAAGLSEAMSIGVKLPFSNIKKRHQVLDYSVSSIQIALRMKRKAGLKSFFVGYNTSLSTKIHARMFTYPVWEILMERMKNVNQQAELLPHQVAACGAVAAGLVGAVTNPLDVARNHLIMKEIASLEKDRLMKVASKKQLSQEVQIIVQPVKPKFNFTEQIPEIYQTVVKIYKQKGIMGLLAGTIARTSSITLGGALFFYFYASTLKWLADEEIIEKLEQEAKKSLIEVRNSR